MGNRYLDLKEVSMSNALIEELNNLKEQNQNLTRALMVAEARANKSEQEAQEMALRASTTEAKLSIANESMASMKNDMSNLKSILGMTAQSNEHNRGLLKGILELANGIT
jgi:predicted DNA-binding ribbon-helix-helix protein